MLPFWEILETQEEKEQILLLYHSFKEILYAVALSMLKEENNLNGTWLSINHV